MSFYQDFPRSNGHAAWPLYGRDTEEASKEDLLWRILQTSPNTVRDIVFHFCPNAKENSNGIIAIDNNYKISLHQNSCGSYAVRGYTISSLQNNSQDRLNVDKAIRLSQHGGYYLGPLLHMQRGMRLDTAYASIARRISIDLSIRKRYLFDKKSYCNRVLMPNDNDKIKDALNKFYPVSYEFNFQKCYLYNTETGIPDFGVAYYVNETGEEFKLPITCWKYEDAFGYHPPIFDALHPSPPYPLFQLDKIVQKRADPYNIVVCPHEEAVCFLEEYHKWLSQSILLTTYSDIEGSDWGILRGFMVIIVPDSSARGCRDAYKIYEALRKQRINARFLKRKKANERHATAFQKDVASQLLISEQTYSLEEFAAFCQSEYGVEPLPGILPKGVPLLELKGSAEHEILLAGLLRLGDQMTLYARRGVGKSYFSAYLMVCFAAGITALDGRICPARGYRILLIDSEMPVEDLQWRFRAICCGLGLEPEGVLKNVSVRSFIHEGRNLTLDSESGWKDLEPDLDRADIIIVDSLSSVFPSAMSPDFSGTEALNKFYAWCKKRGKTAIVIDHQGKKGDTPFGSMGKDIGLDVVLQLNGEGEWKTVRVTKSRNFPSASADWTRYKITSEDDCVVFGNSSLALGNTTVTRNALPPASQDSCEKNSDSEKQKTSSNTLDERIKAFVADHPGASKNEIVTALQKENIAKRSTIYAHIKKLQDSGQLPQLSGSTADSDESITREEQPSTDSAEMS